MIVRAWTSKVSEDLVMGTLRERPESRRPDGVIAGFARRDRDRILRQLSRSEPRV